MPAGNITTVDRFNRLFQIKAFVEEGKTENQIAEELGMSLPSVKRNIKYLDDLAVADLTSKEVGEKREEFYIELVEATEEAKKLFEKYRDDNDSVAAKRFFSSWLESIQLRMKMYGLDSLKVESYTQINQLNQYSDIPDKIDMEAGIRLADMIKRKHEQKLKEQILLSDAKN